MEQISEIYRFTDPIDFLNFEFSRKRLRNHRFSLRAWTRQMGFANPSFVSHVLKRERRLNVGLAEKFAVNLRLDPDQKKYFEVLVLLSSADSVEKRRFYADVLESLRPSGKFEVQSLNLEMFRVISDWYHTAILEMVALRDFRSDVQWINERLGNQVSPRDIEKAIARLCKLGLLDQTESGNLVAGKSMARVLDAHVPDEAIRYFHSQMLEKAQSAIHQQEVNLRDLRGTMLAIRQKDFSRAQEIIKKAHAEIAQLASEGTADDVYHFSTQLFKITVQENT